MKANDLRDQGTDALEQKLAELREERFRMRFSSATQTVDNPIRFRTIRRDIARILTILRERATERAGAEVKSNG
jgi:large subunit ribosomal protein L29